ncbi:MAG: 3'-5' exonuclease, partial [Planctomycetota bacterium]
VDAESGPEGRPIARPPRPGDVAVLFQSLSDVQHYEQALREQRIEYYLDGGHAFYSQQEVYDVLHLLRVVASGCDEVAMAGVLRSPMFALQDETLYWMVRESGSLNGAIADARLPKQLAASEAEKLRRARRTLAELRQLRGGGSTTKILRTAIERTGYDASLLADFLGERKLANLNKLIEQARASDRASTLGPGDVDRFIRQLTEFTVRQPKEALAATTSEGANVVRLMTVHRAKGLEFPIVVVPDLGRRSQGDRRAAAFDEGLGPCVKPATNAGDGHFGLDLLKQRQAPEERAESLRKFYVACTRAADFLLLSAIRDPAGKVTGEWLQTLAGRYDLETGEAHGDAEPIAVSDGDAAAPRPQRDGRQRNRLRLVEEASRSLGFAPLRRSGAGPISLRPDDLQQFSVSRLTGRLHRGRERPRSVALQAALRAKATEVDPLGLGTLVHDALER